MVVVAWRSPLMGWKSVVVYIQDRGFNSLANNMIKLSVKYLKNFVEFLVSDLGHDGNCRN